MTAHVSVEELAPDTPASISPEVVEGLLRGELGFEGIVFTDSMSMHAISRRFTPDRAAALAVQAGADVVLDSPDPDAALRGIREAVARGEIPREQIDRSAERLLRARPGSGCIAFARSSWSACRPSSEAVRARRWRRRSRRAP
jgi:beta-N-acetylhexosaminidase